MLSYIYKAIWTACDQVNAPFKIDYPIMLPSNNQDPANGHVANQRIIDRVFHCKQKRGSLAASKSMNIQVRVVFFVDFFHLPRHWSKFYTKMQLIFC